MSLSTGCVNASAAGFRHPARRFLIRLRLTVAAALVAALMLVPVARSGTNLHKREHRQVVSLHRYVGTVSFFRHHPRLARTAVGRRELRRARVWVRIIRRELAETRAQLRPRYSLPAWWLEQAACIRSHEGAWTSNTGNGYYGAYQFLLGTWRSVGGRGFPHLASPAEQTFRAHLVWLRDGGSWREWGTAGMCRLR